MNKIDPLGFRFCYAAVHDNPNFTREAEILFELGQGPYINHRSKPSEDEGWQALERFPIVLEGYKLIASHHDLDFKDPKVAEAYWIGTDLVKSNFNFSSVHNFIRDNFQRVPRFNLTGKRADHNLYISAYGILTKPGATPQEEKDCKISAVWWDHSTKAAIDENGNPVEISNPFAFNLQDLDLTLAVHRGIACDSIESKIAKRKLSH